jgi:hypothetical protein
MTHKYATICAYILFHKIFFIFERFLAIWLSKYVIIFTGIFIVICSLCNFLLENLKELKKYFYIKVINSELSLYKCSRYRKQISGTAVARADGPVLLAYLVGLDE